MTRAGLRRLPGFDRWLGGGHLFRVGPAERTGRSGGSQFVWPRRCSGGLQLQECIGGLVSTDDGYVKVCGRAGALASQLVDGGGSD